LIGVPGLQIVGRLRGLFDVETSAKLNKQSLIETIITM
jgi:hypothetical protein